MNMMFKKTTRTITISSNAKNSRAIAAIELEAQASPAAPTAVAEAMPSKIRADKLKVRPPTRSRAIAVKILIISAINPAIAKLKVMSNKATASLGREFCNVTEVLGSSFRRVIIINPMTIKTITIKA